MGQHPGLELDRTGAGLPIKLRSRQPFFSPVEPNPEVLTPSAVCAGWFKRSLRYKPSDQFEK